MLHLCPQYFFVVLSLVKYRQNFILAIMEYHGSTFYKRCDILSFVRVKSLVTGTSFLVSSNT